MDWSQLTIGVIGTIASIAAAIFAYPIWRESRKRPALRLGVYNTDATAALKVVEPEAKRCQIVCGLTLYNEGNREARNWRVRLVIGKPGIVPGLSIGPPRIVRDPYFVSEKWVSEIFAGGPADTVTPETPALLGRRNGFNFEGRPAFSEINYTIDAENMTTRKGTLRFIFNWDDKTAHCTSE